MENDARAAKKRAQAGRLRDTSPQTTLRMRFERSDFIRALSEAASRVHA